MNDADPLRNADDLVVAAAYLLHRARVETQRGAEALPDAAPLSAAAHAPVTSDPSQ